MNRVKFLAIILLSILSILALVAKADSVAIRTGDWLLIKTDTDCYAFTKSFRTLVDDTIYDNFSQLRIVNKGDNQYTFSVLFNKSLSENTQAKMLVGTNNYLLNYGRTNSAWSYSSSQDVSLINELGSTSEEFIKVISYDANNNKAIDYFSIKGLVHALQLMDRNCSSSNE